MRKTAARWRDYCADQRLREYALHGRSDLAMRLRDVMTDNESFQPPYGKQSPVALRYQIEKYTFSIHEVILLE